MSKIGRKNIWALMAQKQTINKVNKPSTWNVRKLLNAIHKDQSGKKDRK